MSLPPETKDTYNLITRLCQCKKLLLERVIISEILPVREKRIPDIPTLYRTFFTSSSKHKTLHN